MKRLIVLALILPLLVVSGCAYEVVPTPSSPPVTIPSDVTTKDDTVVEPTVTPPVRPVTDTSSGAASGSLFFKPSSEVLDYVVVAPAYFEFGTVSAGSTIDTFTEDSYLQVGKHKVTYNKGDPLYFIIFNDSVNSYTYEVRYEDAIDDITWSEATQQAYYKAPRGVEQGVTLYDSSVTLEAGEARTMPFSLVVPEDTKYPEYWEFRISILRRDPGAMQQVGGRIRVFVSMK